MLATCIKVVAVVKEGRGQTRDVRRRDEQEYPTRSPCHRISGAGRVRERDTWVVLFSGVGVARSQHSNYIRSVICEKDEEGLGKEEAPTPPHSGFPTQGTNCGS